MLLIIGGIINNKLYKSGRASLMYTIDKDTNITPKTNNNTYITKANVMSIWPNNLGNTEYKIFLFILACIKKDDEELPAILINYKVLLKILDLDKSLHSRSRVEQYLTSLASKVFYVKDRMHYQVMSIFQRIAVKYNDDSSVLIEINPYFAPYLINLRNNFSRYRLNEIIPFSSVYSIKLYDILAANAYRTVLVISVEELRIRLNLKNTVEKKEIDKFKKFGEFNRNVLNPCIQEINEKSSLQVEIEKIADPNDKRKVASIRFIIYVTKDINPLSRIPEYYMDDRIIEDASDIFKRSGTKKKCRVITLQRPLSMPIIPSSDTKQEL